MTATIHQLRPDTPPIAGYLRLGHTGHRKLLELHAASRFHFRRVVVDAAHAAEQRDLLATLRMSGCEIVLDPNMAEMATAGRFASSVSKLPWANPDRPWTPDDFGRDRNLNTAKAIAEFAIAIGAHAVLAPTHLVETTDGNWSGVDARLCEALRHELNLVGGSDVAIDYQLITTAGLLKEPGGRAALMGGVADLPVQNLWLRISGFGATATGAGTRAVLEALGTFHELKLPVVLDQAGGFAGLAVAAFGGAGGLSHGVGQKESFKAADWRKPPSGGGGSGTRTYLAELDRHFNEEQLRALFEAKGARPRFGCADATCCPHGMESMIENPHAHFLTQRNRQLAELSTVPEERRMDYFLLRQLDPAVRSARFAAKLKLGDEKVAKSLGEAKARLIRFRDALGNLHEGGAPATRSRSPLFRGVPAAPAASVLVR